jgi:hypothetical protein
MDQTTALETTCLWLQKEILVAPELGLTNPEELLTKPIPGGQRRKDLVCSMLYNVHNEVKVAVK